MTDVNVSTCKKFLNESEIRSTHEATLEFQRVLTMKARGIVASAKEKALARGAKTISADDLS